MTMVTGDQPKRQTPTVSVAVISYNAAATIEDTLDSILRQDHDQKLTELVISDDASNDATVAVTRSWLEQNGHAFGRIEHIANQTNRGVSGNCNVAWRACTGEWIKTIAADDILLPRCLSANIEFLESHPDCSVIVSKMRWFGSVNRITPEPSHLRLFKLSALDQYRALRFGSFNFAPTSFMRKKALEAVGYADESFRNIEDLPLWLRLTKEGFRLCFNDQLTVEYRVSDSISKSTSRFVNVPFLLDLIKLHQQQKPLESDGFTYRYLRFERSISLYSTLLISRLCRNRRSGFSRSLEALALILRPVDLYGALRRRLGRLAGLKP
jgi:glycosyltransferase involved in cell wall biosynthesis